MTNPEAILQEQRLSKYQKLKALRGKYRDALHVVTVNDPEGPHGQGPFTGNTRETREVLTMNLTFSKTLGGANMCGMQIEFPGIPAYDLGKFLKQQLEMKLNEIDKEIENI